MNRVPDITAADITALRKATGAGMMDAKRALQDAEGDLGKAKDLLRERGLADARKRSARVTTQGAIGHYLHFQAERPVIGVLVELAAETDFVAKSPDFQQAARDIAMHIAASRPRWVHREDVPEEELAKEKELIAAQARNEGKPEKIIERIVEGRLKVFFEEHVLYEQPFVNPERFAGTVGEMVQGMAGTMGENILVRRFARLGVGEPSG
jgi:elongation factor Ts